MKPIYKPSKTMLPTSHSNLVIDDEEGKESKDDLLLPPPAVHRRFLGKGRRLGSRTHCVATVAITISILCLASCVLIGCIVYFRLTGLTAATEKLAAPGEVCLPCAQVSPHPLDPDVTVQALLQTLETRYQAQDEDRANPECCASTPGQYAALFKLVLKRQEEVKRLGELLDPQEAVEGSNLPQAGLPSKGGLYDYGTDPVDYDGDFPQEDATDAPEGDYPAVEVNTAENDDIANDDDTAADDDDTAADDDDTAADDGDDADDDTAPIDDMTTDDNISADDDTAADDTSADAEGDADNDDDDATAGDNNPDVEDDDDDDNDSPAESSSSRKFIPANKLSSVSAHLTFKPPTDSSAKENLVQWKSPAESVLSDIRRGLVLDSATQTTINVTSAGHYFVYCQMLYTARAATTDAAEGSVVSSYVHRRSLTYPASSGILLKTRHTRHDVSNDRHSSYVAGLFYLQVGDELYVQVSDPGFVSNDDGASFFGLFMVGD